MLRLFGKYSGQVYIHYLTEDFKMDLAHNVGKFLQLLEYFSEAHLLYPMISDNKEAVCSFSDSHKKQILRYCAF